MNKSPLKYILFLAIAVLIISIDQITKHIAFDQLSGKPPIDVLPILQWALVFNRGAAFGFLSEAGGIQHYLFVGLASVVTIILLVWLWRSVAENKILSWGLTLVMAGAIGNLIDRLSYQYVIDFISVHYQNWYFPAFNIADASITLGAIFLIMDAFGIGQEKS